MCQRWNNAQEGERAGIDDFFVIDEDLERAVWPRFDRNLGREVAPQHGCRPGSLNRDNSVSTTTDDNAHGAAWG
jgi:hypothetical protein